MPTCCACCCGNRSSGRSMQQQEREKEKPITFHKFPKDLERRTAWAKAIGRICWEPNNNSVVCSEHFTEDSFDRTSFSKVRLRETAVPSIFSSRSDYLQKKQEKLQKKRVRVSDTPGIAPILSANVAEALCTSDEVPALDIPCTNTSAVPVQETNNIRKLESRTSSFSPLRRKHREMPDASTARSPAMDSERETTDIFSFAETELGIEIPEYMKNVLIINGLESATLIAQINADDIQEIERYTREELHTLIEKEDFPKYYGPIFSKNPVRFQFVFGHRKILNLLIDFCKEIITSENKLESNSADELQNMLVGGNSSSRNDVSSCSLGTVSESESITSVVSVNTSMSNNLTKENSVILQQLKSWVKKKVEETRWDDFSIQLDSMLINSQYSETNDELFCNITCVCGKSFKIFKLANKDRVSNTKRWVLSNFFRHLLNKHLNVTENKCQKITSFFQFQTESELATKEKNILNSKRKFEDDANQPTSSKSEKQSVSSDCFSGTVVIKQGYDTEIEQIYVPEYQVYPGTSRFTSVGTMTNIETSTKSTMCVPEDFITDEFSNPDQTHFCDSSTTNTDFTLVSSIKIEPEEMYN